GRRKLIQHVFQPAVYFRRLHLAALAHPPKRLAVWHQVERKVASAIRRKKPLHGGQYPPPQLRRNVFEHANAVDGRETLPGLEGRRIDLERCDGRIEGRIVEEAPFVPFMNVLPATHQRVIVERGYLATLFG